MEMMNSDSNIQTTELPAKGQGAILSLETRQLFETVNCGIISSAVCLFGIVANIINITIFFRQGLNTTVNISLFGIAVADFCSLITLLWLNICLTPLLENSGVPMVPSEIQYLTGGWPHVCFTRITCGITVYVTAERCLCITLPLKVKHIITPRRTKIAICFIYLFMFLSTIPEYTTTYIGWKFYEDRNKTLLGLKFSSNRAKVEGLVYVLNATLALVSFTAVTLCTAILVWKLKRASEWRQRSTGDNHQSMTMCVRDRKTMNLIVVIAIILIVCYTPGTCLLLTTFFEPEFGVLGKYVNVFLTAWSFGLLFEAINASVNIFLYHRMSSRYRQTFRRMFSRCFRRNVTLTYDLGIERSRSSTTGTQKCNGERSDSDKVLQGLVLDKYQIDLSDIVRLSPDTPIRRSYYNGHSADSSKLRRAKKSKRGCLKLHQSSGPQRSPFPSP